jgi:phage/plasmid-associated DNA primase
METLLELMPRPLATGVDFESFTAKRDGDSQNFDLADLKPARMVFASESNKYQSLNPAKIKSLTGGDHIRCAKKHRDHFSYRPQFKVWLISNHPVRADADDNALWHRVQVLPFPTSHADNEDTTLKARLRTPEALERVLAWALAGAMGWYALKRLKPPVTVTKATAEQRREQDHVALWIEDRCTLDPQKWTASSVLLASFNAWREGQGSKPARANDLASALVKRFECESHKGTHGVRGFRGIACLVAPDGGGTQSAATHDEPAPPQGGGGVTAPWVAAVAPGSREVSHTRDKGEKPPNQVPPPPPSNRHIVSDASTGAASGRVAAPESAATQVPPAGGALNGTTYATQRMGELRSAGVSPGAADDIIAREIAARAANGGGAR